MLNKRLGSVFMSIGAGFFTITVINDVLYTNEVVFTGNYAPFGLFIFIFAQSFILSIRSSRAFSSVEMLSATFQKFVPSKFLDRIAKKGIESIEVGNAESDIITVLFSDIRDFTSISEKMSPEELLNFLNAYFKRMNQVIHKNNGVIDKFIGDAIMALYDRPELLNQDEARDAVKSAIAMQNALMAHNQHQQNCGYPAISTGIGIHSGKAVIGTVGSIDRMDSTVLGDVVNVASRLESLTKYYKTGIIISSDTWRLLLPENHDFLWRKLDYIAVKGKEQPIDIYEIFNADPDEIKDKKHKILKPYHEALELYYSRQWPEAVKIFKECLTIYREDPVIHMHLERCLQFKENPPPENWKGIIKMSEK
jgi:adenylate cyclase